MTWTRTRRAALVGTALLVALGLTTAVAGPATAASEGWTTASSMATARGDHTATALPDGSVAVQTTLAGRRLGRLLPGDSLAPVEVPAT